MLRDRPRENELVQANFILVLGNMIEERWTSDGGTTSPRRSGVSSNGPHAISSRLAILRTLVMKASVVARQTEACRFAA